VKVLTGAGLLLATLSLPVCFLAKPAPAQNASQRPESEIVAALSGGEVIVLASKDKIIFVAINQPIEQGAPPPRLAELSGGHVGVLFGASEWRMPADPKPVRLDRDVPRYGRQDPHAAPYGQAGEADLETMGEAFLERLHSLASQLHHNINFPADQALLRMVVIGFGPDYYGPEVWDVDYRLAQQNITSTGADYWQTRILRPRFDQLYPPEKHSPHKIVEIGYPGPLKGPTVQQLIEGNDPRVAQLCTSNPEFAKAVALIAKGDAQKADTTASTDFLRALIPVLFPNQTFFMGTIEEQHGFDWIVPPEEPVEKAKSNEKKTDKQGDAPPSLRTRPYSP
jgi:hypothetical protein